ncbi:MAG: RnfABCDGE type electron transport complex subunit G [Ruminococcus sp.]|nr:RnfABCDGE type electron transport complex subunit G [Ruminococcus sp.]
MRFKITPKAILIPTISLFLICLVVTAALALTNNVTAEKIAENEAQSKQESMFSVLPEADHFEQVFEGIDDMYIGVDKNGNEVGYAISTATQGYGGQVKVMTGIKDNKIIGVDVFYNDDETPGLGKNTSNESFRDQYKELLSDGSISVSKDGGEGQTVDAVTSATISSRAVTKAVNHACLLYSYHIAYAEKTWEELNETVDQMNNLPVVYATYMSYSGNDDAPSGIACDPDTNEPMFLFINNTVKEGE